MQNAKAHDHDPNPAKPGAVMRQPGSNLPARVSSMPIEPPHPREVEDKLQFRSAAQYKKAVALAERYTWQARLAVDRRMGSVKKSEKQAKLDHEETVHNYQRQIAQAQARYKGLIEQSHAKHRQALFQARVAAHQAEEVYKAALANVPGYGVLRLRAMAFNDARAVTQGLVSAYKSSLGHDGMGHLDTFLASLDKVIDLARDRNAVVPMQFAESLLKGIAHRQLKQAGTDKLEAERIKQAAGARLLMLQGFASEQRVDATPGAIATAYFAVHEWLGKATGSPFDLALDRLKRDVESLVRKEHAELERRIEAAMQHTDQLHLLAPVAESYERAQRGLASAEQAAKGVLHQEVSRIEIQLEKEVQLADAMVVGMDHTASRRLAEAKRAVANAKKMVGRWTRVLDELEEIGGWQRFIWRLTENFDHDAFWLDLRARQMNRS